MPADNDRSPHDVVLPVHAETVSITKRRTTGQVVRVATETRSRTVAIDEPLTHYGVVVEHVPVGRYVDAMPAIREEGDVTIMPIVEEEVVVTRRLLLREEIHVRRVKTTKQHRETLTVREQQVAVTRDTLDPVRAASLAGAGDAVPVAATPAASYQTIVAVFDTPAHAELALNDLLEAGVPLESVHRHTSAGSYAGGSAVPAARETQGRGFWASLLGDDIGDDHLVYDATLQRGGTVVTVTGVPDHDYPTVLAILESHQPVKLDDHEAPVAVPGATASGVPDMTAIASFPLSEDLAAVPLALVSPTTAASVAPGAAGLPAGDGATIQLAEESLAVGKRRVERGGLRVRRYVIETPVSQDVTLHSETVTVERHPVLDGGPVTGEEFTDRVVEMIETAEEAVVSKTARVVEEIRLHKEVSDRVETVHETVRKEAVAIEQIAGADAAAAGPGPIDG